MSETAAPPRVVIADDQALVRGGFRMILGAAGIPVAAEAADGTQAVAAVLKHRPDVVLMDIRMPQMDGLEATRRILAAPAASGCRIIILKRACRGRTFAQRRGAAIISVFRATGIRLSELAEICYDAEDTQRSDLDL